MSYVTLVKIQCIGAISKSGPQVSAHGELRYSHCLFLNVFLFCRCLLLLCDAAGLKTGLIDAALRLWQTQRHYTGDDISAPPQ